MHAARANLEKNAAFHIHRLRIRSPHVQFQGARRRVTPNAKQCATDLTSMKCRWLLLHAFQMHAFRMSVHRACHLPFLMKVLCCLHQNVRSSGVINEHSKTQKKHGISRSCWRPERVLQSSRIRRPRNVFVSSRKNNTGARNRKHSLLEFFLFLGPTHPFLSPI